MALSSMTGFARGHGVAGTYAWSWELKSVNSKGLDLKLRLPPGWDAIEATVRARASEVLSRGSVFANLTVSREGVGAGGAHQRAGAQRGARDAQGAVGQGRRRAADARRHSLAQGRDRGERGRRERRRARRGRERDRRGLRAGAQRACRDAPHRGRRARKNSHRRGFRKSRELAARAEATPGRKPEAIKARLAEKIAELLDGSQRFDPDRLHQEAILLATKADIREELDRLTAHVAQGKKLIADGGPIGRKLDFLAQELNRESNTLCSKANDLELTNIGLELKAVVEQFREQVQNLE